MRPEMRQDELRGDEIDLLEYWRVLKKRGLMILALTFLSASTAGSYTYFFAPKIYESRATILSPKESTGAGGLAGLLAATSGGAGQLLQGLAPGGGTNRDVFLAILKSRTMAQDLVERFKLMEYYGTTSAEVAVRSVQGSTEVSLSKEGVIAVKVEDKDPRLAANIANAYITNLDRHLARFGTTDASRQRAFLADRLEKTEATLRRAEENLRRFQEKNKTLAVQEHARGAIESAAKVRAQIITAEANLEFMRSYSTEDNPQVVALKRQTEELKRQLSQVQYGRGMELPPEDVQAGKPRAEFHVPFTQLPEVGMELVRLIREVKIQEAVFTLLTQQFEQAKIAEAKDTPTVQVLDKAVPAERKSKPSSVVNAAIAGILAFVMSGFLAFLLEFLDRARQRERASAQAG